MPLNTGKYANNESIIYAYLKNYGLNEALICGFLANIEHECNFNPYITNSIGAFGICQWLSGRKSTLISKYGSKPTLQNQIAYIMYEVNHVAYEKSLYEKYIKNIANSRLGAYTAGHNIAKYYERCESAHFVRRANRAQAYWDYYVTGKAAEDIKTSGALNSYEESSDIESNVPAYTSLSTIDPYSGYISSNLSRVVAAGYDYGYLIDMTHGKEFRFYIPEFSESAGANWSNVDIPGRSVSIKSYSNTESRSVAISLELYAGVGLYSSGEDVVGDMHKDANFVKSLEYPDYDNFISRPPSTVHLILGSAFNLVGVVSDVSVEHLKPRDSQNRSMYIKLSFTVTQIATNPPGYQDIRDGIYSIPSSSSR